MRFKDYLANEFETSEHHYIPSLRSRYYSVRGEQAMDAVRSLAKKMNAVIKYVDNERQEIIFETSRFSATATITSISYTVTAVDFIVVTNFILPLGRGKKILEEIYFELDKMIPFKNVGLYRE